MSFWDKISDALPWNQRKAREREELEKEIQAMADDDVEPAGSAAEAMAAMKAQSKARRAPEKKVESDEDLSVGGVPHRADSGENQAEKDRIRRNKGG